MVLYRATSMVLRYILAGLLPISQVPESPRPAAGPAMQWRAPPLCPDRTALLRGIQTRLGRSLRAQELSIDGVVTMHETPPLYRLDLRLTTRGHEERRTLTAKTCASLADATAVLAVLAVLARPRKPVRPPVGVSVDAPVAAVGRTSGDDRPGPQASGDEPPEGLELTTDPPAAAPMEPIKTTVEVLTVEAGRPPEQTAPDLFTAATPAKQAAASALRRGPGAVVRVHAGPELGALPGLTAGVGLAAGLLWRRARLEVQGLYLAPRTAVSPHGDLHASLFAGAVHGCARLGRGTLEIPLCGGLELGGMRGDARGAPEGRDVTGWWLAALVGTGVAVDMNKRWSLWVALQLLAGLAKSSFEARDPGPAVTLFRPAPVTGRLLLGVELRFGDPR